MRGKSTGYRWLSAHVRRLALLVLGGLAVWGGVAIAMTMREIHTERHQDEAAVTFTARLEQGELREGMVDPWLVSTVGNLAPIESGVAFETLPGTGTVATTQLQLFGGDALRVELDLGLSQGSVGLGVIGANGRWVRYETTTEPGRRRVVLPYVRTHGSSATLVLAKNGEVAAQGTIGTPRVFADATIVPWSAFGGVEQGAEQTAEYAAAYFDFQKHLQRGELASADIGAWESSGLGSREDSADGAQITSAEGVEGYLYSATASLASERRIRVVFDLEVASGGGTVGVLDGAGQWIDNRNLAAGFTGQVVFPYLAPGGDRVTLVVARYGQGGATSIIIRHVDVLQEP